MDQKTIAKLESEANKLATIGFQFHADLLRTACKNRDGAMVQRVAVLLNRAKRTREAQRLTALVGVPGWDKVEV